MDDDDLFDKMTIAEKAEAFESLIRQGRVIKTKRVRNGQPVYVTREFATPEEIAAADKARLQ